MKQHLQGSPTQKLRATVSSGLEISKKKTVLGFQDLDIILVRIVVGFWWSKTRQKKKKTCHVVPIRNNLHIWSVCLLVKLWGVNLKQSDRPWSTSLLIGARKTRNKSLFALKEFWHALCESLIAFWCLLILTASTSHFWKQHPTSSHAALAS